VSVVLPGRRRAELGQPLAVERGDIVAGIQQLVEPLDLGDADRGLQVGEAIVEADAVVLDRAAVLGRAAVVALARHPIGDVPVR